MTPAINLLKKSGEKFEILEFDHDKSNLNFAKEAAQKLNVSDSEVFKTLMIEVDGKLAVAITPCTQQVDLKSFAKAAGGKRAVMTNPEYAEKITGYIVGGISPFAQKKRLPTFLHQSAETMTTILVSAGKRGLEVRVSPGSILLLCGAKYALF